MIQGGNGTGAGTEAILIEAAIAGDIIIGKSDRNGTITIGKTTDTNVISIGTGVTGVGRTQVIDIGTGTVNASATTAIAIGNAIQNGSSVPRSTTTVNGKVAMECGTGAATANAITLEKQCGVITSSTSNLGAVTSGTITLTDARIASTNIILATINGVCTSGKVVVESAVAGTGSATISVRNVHATDACASTYKIGFMILSQ